MTGESYREGGLVESLGGARGKPGPEVVTVEAEHGEEGNLVLKTLSLHQKYYPCIKNIILAPTETETP